MPFRKIFRNRWAALLWAGGIVWTAVDVVGFGPPAHFAAAKAAPAAAADADNTDATGVAVNSEDLATLANAMKGG